MHQRTIRWPAVISSLAVVLSALLLVPALALQTSPRVKGIAWERIGQGMISHAPIITLAVDPEVQDLVLAGAYHHPGLFRTTNGGESWSADARGLDGLSVFALQLDPRDRKTVYLGATDGLYRSVDGGNTWHKMAEGLPRAVVYALAMDTEGTLYAGTDGHGVYMSTDQGQTFTLACERLREATILSLALDHAGQSIVAGTSGQGLFISRDSGASWTEIPELGSAFVSKIALSPNGQSGFACTREGFWRTKDNGRSWVQSAAKVRGRINAVTYHPRDSRTVYAGTARGDVFRSTDGGDTWGHAASLKRAIYTITIHPMYPQRIYAGAWDGVYRSSDAGDSWEQVNRGLGSVLIEALALDEQDPRILYAGNTLDGVYRSADGGASWSKVGNSFKEGERGYGVLSLAIAPSNNHMVYAGTNGRGVYLSSDCGETWKPTGTGLQVGIGAIAVHPENANHLYVRAFFDRVYESDDGGVSWRPRWEGMSDETEIISLAIDRHHPSTLYAGGEDGLYVTKDGASSWAKAGLEGLTVFCVVVHPHDGDQIYAGTTGGVHHSRDGGLSWSPWGQGLSGITVSTLVIDPNDPRTMYAGTKYHGCFWSQDGGRTWLPANQGLQSLSVNTLILHPDDGLLYAATPDGVYRGLVQ
jgi:photosystem II stability/assembly factor-like uncharacterized protein